jgi:hypothetical protein
MKKYCLIIQITVFFLIWISEGITDAKIANYFQSSESKSVSQEKYDGSKKIKILTKKDSIPPDTVIATVRTYIHHISNLNFRDEEYNMEFLLFLTSKVLLPDYFVNQVDVKNAKRSKISFISLWHDGKKTRDSLFLNSKSTALVKDSCFRRLLRVECIMAQEWDIDGFPFDSQKLDITIYTIRPLRWFLFRPVEHDLNYANIKDSVWEIENGWFSRQDSANVNPKVISDIFDNSQRYSALHYVIPIYRNNAWGLFFKLFIGMYVAFLVAFIAMFIPAHEVEPRFGLPVGGLFAAIANKYIIEALLPSSTEFNLIDKLHSTAIISILIIIIYSAILYHLTEKNKSHELVKDKLRFARIKKFDHLIIGLLFLVYLAANLSFIKYGWGWE